MISRIHNKLGTAGLIVAMVALLAALGGAAVAAAPKLNSTQKKEVKSIAQTEAKKVMTAGPQGPAGKDGASGINGTNGTNGKDGAQGAPGKNGETGFTDTLPSGKTETGTFSVPTINGAATPASPLVPISYNIPLASGTPPTVNVIGKDGTTAVLGNKANCPGTNADPEANPGNLCLYADPVFTEKLTFAFAFSNGPTGAVINLTVGAEGGVVMGTWAVTAPTS